jgi:hypothetical protein
VALIDFEAAFAIVAQRVLTIKVAGVNIHAARADLPGVVDAEAQQMLAQTETLILFPQTKVGNFNIVPLLIKFDVARWNAAHIHNIDMGLAQSLAQFVFGHQQAITPRQLFPNATIQKQVEINIDTLKLLNPHKLIVNIRRDEIGWRRHFEVGGHKCGGFGVEHWSH